MSNEVERLEEYSNALRQSLSEMMKEYNSQFKQLTEMVDNNRDHLNELRVRLSQQQGEYYQVKAKNEALEQELETKKIQVDLKANLNEETNSKTIQAEIKNAERKQEALSQEY